LMTSLTGRLDVADTMVLDVGNGPIWHLRPTNQNGGWSGAKRLFFSQITAAKRRPNAIKIAGNKYWQLRNGLPSMLRAAADFGQRRYHQNAGPSIDGHFPRG
jgi:hypothetical protein